MSINALSGIEITDADIDEIELILGDVRFDEQRRNILRCMDSVDVQAFPGSGKTTVLIAKLAILAKKWPYSDRGICVLSHTNVARDEIETRLGNTNVGKALLSYPHFVGTVHSFFDTFAGLPWLRCNGYPITMIDTEVTLSRRYRQLSQSTKYYLSHNNLSEYACESLSFPISINIKCGETAASYKNVYDCIDRSFNEGYFTFDEMLHISKYAVGKCKYLPSAIQKRFPILLIDEAQDTGRAQWDLINSSFPDGRASVRQSFGDANQAIFQSYGKDETNSAFPSGDYMTISSSHRFGKEIAHLADPLGVAVKGLEGTLSTFDKLNGKHTIFLFDQVSDVLPAYATYLLSCFTDGEINCGLECFAVGMVHNKGATDPADNKYPVGIKDYYSNYDPNTSRQTYKPKYLIEFFEMGLRKFAATNDYYSLVESISDGFRKYIKEHSALEISHSYSAFNSLLKLIPDNNKKSFRTDLFALLELATSFPDAWDTITASACLVLEKHFDITEYCAEFFSQVDTLSIGNSEESSESNEKNVFTYQEGGRTIRIHLSSIHAVKGRTHLGMLVLDTYWYKRNIQSILPWLCNNGTKKTPKAHDITRLKCHYVALTRAKGLICIAALKSSVSNKEKDSLVKAGWNVVEL